MSELRRERAQAGVSAGARQAEAGPSTSSGVRAEALPQSRQADASGSAAPFVNDAYNLWVEQRREWVGNRARQRPARRQPAISPDATYEDLLTTSQPFAQPIPLPEMVDFLVDVWDQDGLYD
ncbi:hypothetical protein KFL_000990130 [Klebsormidium nitens]|uniref:Gag1-like clamp domain-containing protein n=1 Tax=Klebsormidium nitens TaxID=105231 RepID=A0A1Y1HTV9_KLENI|nr:hypothetical protein KFL_000990130 [Klebsormidium nitens]|eukprot:GAQ82064.1 hypothetical protein KFL_000990130 [Klebsormidium nitens]